MQVDLYNGRERLLLLLLLYTAVLNDVKFGFTKRIGSSHLKSDSLTEACTKSVNMLRHKS